MKILDCTLRDGGYYTNWDFSKPVVEQLIKSINSLPIDYIEVGYRNLPSDEYMGKYAYCPVYEMKTIRSKTNKKIVLMLNEKDASINNLNMLLEPVVGLADMIRMAVDPVNVERAIELAKDIKKYGFEVGFNVMYMSKWKSIGNFVSSLSKLDGVVDAFFMVDSYGGVTPDELVEITKMVKEYTQVPLGFHGHNNLELALINAITAMKNGVEFIDATVLGMGRGAGNLKMELLLTYLNNNGLEVDFNSLGKLVTAFTPLLEKYQWGTNLPYMISGANSLPQKDVMDWVSNRMYSFNSIVRALDNKKNKRVDNQKYPLLKSPTCENVLIVGGGASVEDHIDGILAFIANNDIAIIHSTARNASLFFDVDKPQYYCMAGGESERIEKTFLEETLNGTCILPPYPREMGTDVPSFVQNKTVEVETITFTDKAKDSCTALALQIALELNAKNIYIVGYDGYPEGNMSQKERTLSLENEFIFDQLIKTGVCLTSLTPTLYKDLSTHSIYSLVD